MTRILFIPDVRATKTSERVPLFYRMLAAGNEVVSLPARWDRRLYDPSRPKLPRYVLYMVDKLVLAVNGLRLARANRTEVVFCATAHHALAGLLIARMLGIRCVWSSDGNVLLFSRSVGKGRFFTVVSVLAERFLGKRVDALITVSERDAEAYVDMGVPRRTVSVIPLLVDLSLVPADGGPAMEASTRSPPRRPVLLLFGSFKYAPNLEALNYVDGTLAPFLEGRGIDCEIRIAGRDIPARAFHRSIRVLGFVPSIYPEIRAADLCIVPIWTGVGVLTKVLDTMAVGTPGVLSRFAAESVGGVRDRVNAFVASSMDSFPQVVLDALNSPEARRTISRNARELIAQEYDSKLYIDQLDRILAGHISSESSAADLHERRNHHV